MAEVGETGLFRGIRRSVIGAAVLLAWDVVLTGSFLMSLIFCPIWFLVSLLRSAIRRPGWTPALARIGIPAATLGLVLANDAFQIRTAETNARRVVAACETYRAAHGRLPEKLPDLVPDYLPAVPPAKHCLCPSSQFLHINPNPDKALLVWYVIPPYYRKIYNFETRRWSHME